MVTFESLIAHKDKVAVVGLGYVVAVGVAVGVGPS